MCVGIFEHCWESTMTNGRLEYSLLATLVSATAVIGDKSACHHPYSALCVRYQTKNYINYKTPAISKDIKNKFMCILVIRPHSKCPLG